MHTFDLSTASLNDIVFEGRNKAYGAFVLRQLYHRHLARAMAIAVALSLLLVITPLVINGLFPVITVAPEVTDLPKTTTLIEPPKIIADKPVGNAAAPHPVVRPESTPTHVVRDIEVKPELDVKPIAPVIGPSTADIEIPSAAGDGPITGDLYGLGSRDTAGSGLAEVVPPSRPFDVAEVMPKFRGGDEALMRYMQKNLRYPPMALRNGVSGRVYISFTVQADGAIADVQVLKGLGFGTDEEATRVVQNMPAWMPGQQNKHNVAVRYTMPITFHYE